MFPELALTTFFPRWDLDEDEMLTFFEREMPSDETRPLFEEAARLGVGFHLGYAELTDDGHRYNSAVVVGRDGKVVARYRKVHLPGHEEPEGWRPFQHLERKYFEPGPEGFHATKAFGGVIGVALCNDRRWSETYRVFGLQGVELLLVGYNTPVHYPPDPNQDHLQAFHNNLVMASGAYQNGMFVVGVAKAGVEEGVELLADSQIIAPSGEVIARAETVRRRGGGRDDRPRRLRPLQADGVRLPALPPPVDVRADHRAPRPPGLRLTRSATARRKGLARSASQRQTGQTVRLAGSLDCFDWSAIGARGMRVVAVFVRYCLRSRWAGASHREIAGMRPGWFRSLVAGVAVGAFCAWWLVAPSPAGSDPAVSEALMTFGFTGAAQTYLVPEDVCAVTVTAAGANGGSAEAAGGTGGQIEATFAVSPHESLTIVVGGHGTTMNTGTAGGAGGFGRGSGGAGGSGGRAWGRGWRRRDLA